MKKKPGSQSLSAGPGGAKIEAAKLF